MAKRRRRKRGKAGKVRWLMIVAIALLIAGFMARRLMMPGAARELTHRGPDYTSQAPQSGDAGNGEAAPSEHLSDSDRRALDEVIRRKTGGH